MTSTSSTTNQPQQLTDNVLYSLQTELVYKLQFIGYNDEFLSHYHSFHSLTYNTFITQSNNSFQLFISLIQWLININNIQNLKKHIQYTIYDNPANIINNIIQLSNDIKYNKYQLTNINIRSGTGLICIDFLLYITNMLINQKNLLLQPCTIQPNNDINDIQDNNVDDDSIIEDDIIINQFMNNNNKDKDKSTQQHNDIVKQQFNIIETINQYEQQYKVIESEIEEYNHKLKYNNKSINSSIYSNYNDNSNKLDNNNLLANYIKSMTNMTEQIQLIETTLNNSYKTVVTQYDVLTVLNTYKQQYNELKTEINTLYSNIEALNNELTSKAQRIEQCKTSISELEHKNTNTLPLKNIQKSYNIIKQQTNELTMRINILQYKLYQKQNNIKQNNAHNNNKKSVEFVEAL